MSEFAARKSTLRLHTWLLSVHTALLITILWRVFTL
jgi:hypothetical protein